MDKWELLEELRDVQGEYVSGESISKKFGVTRSAIWKNINELKSLGYEIVSKTNNGYKLSKPFDILNAHEIEHRLAAKNLSHMYGVIYKHTIDSTNSEAKRLNQIDSGDRIIIAASEQTGGRGRYNRSFSSKEGVGIYFTVRINSSPSNQMHAEDITFYPLIAALSVCRAAKRMCGADLKIKWPNDLLYRDKKICGILTEASLEAESRSVTYAIIGIGININNTIEDFPDEIKDKAISFRIISEKRYDRAAILCEAVENLTKLVATPREKILEEYRRHLITGRKVIFVQDNIKYTASVYDINADGNLIVSLDGGGTMTIQSGEINFI